MRIDNPSISGSLSFINGNNTIAGDLVNLTGSLSGSFAGEFSGEAQTAISGAASLDTSSLATTGSNLFVGNQTHSGSILPAVNDTYDLGSTSYQWRDLFLSSGSLYIDGTQVISSDANTLTFTTDAGQSIKILETGGDDITFQTDTGNIEMKGTVEVQSGKKIIDSAGTVIQFGDTLGVTGSIEVSGTVDGIDLQIMSSSLSASIAGVSTDFDDITNKPTLLSGSAQIATDISGSSTSLSSSLASELLKNTTDTLTGDLTVTGTLTAQEFHTEFVSASILFDSGSTKFGDTQDDVHNFTGSLKTTGSMNITGTTVLNDTLYLSEYLQHLDNTGTNIRLQTDRMTLTGGGGSIVDLNNNGNLYFTGGSTFYNNVTLSSASTPILKVEDTTNSHYLFMAADDSNSFMRSDGTLLFQVGAASSTVTALNITATGNATFANNVTVGNDLTVGDDINISGEQLTFTDDAASAYIRAADALLIQSDYNTGENKPIYLQPSAVTELTIATGTSTFAGTITAGDGTQAINADADLTLRNGNSFVGIDLKSARTSGNIGGLRYYGTASDSVPVAQFLVETDGQLKYYNGTNGAQSRFIVNSSGNVGIGISPSATFHVDASNLTNNVAAYIGGAFIANDLYHREGGLLVISGTNTTQTSAGIAFQTRNTGNTNYWKSSILMNRGGELEFYTGGAGTGQGTRRITITSGGNLGIGTPTPEEKMVVMGNIGFGGGGYNGGVYANNTDSATGVDSNWGLEVQRTSGVDDYNTRLKYYPTNGTSRKAGIWNSRDSNFTIYSDDDTVPNVIIPTGNVGINNTNPSAHSSDHNHLVVGSGVNDGNHGSANAGITIFTDDSTFPYSDYARLVFTHSTLLGRGYTFEYLHRDNSSFADDEPSFKLIAGNDDYIAITTQDNNSSMPKVMIDPNYYYSSLTQGNLYRAMFTIPVRSGVNNPGMHIYGDSQGNSNPFLGFTSTSSSSSITTKFIRFYHNSTLCGTIQKKFNANEVQYLTTSDYRLKEDLKPFKALDTICKVNVYNFKWKDIEGDNVNYGVLAHELQELIPEVVAGEKDEVTEEGEAELQGVDYSKLVPHLIQSIQELKAEIDKLKK